MVPEPTARASIGQTEAPGHTLPIARSRPVPARWTFLAITALTLVLLTILPPLISVNRYQHRVSTSISSSLGRPVHFDHVALNLVPVPSFTFTNFVVEEDPDFGAEPIIRANTVVATLRFGSLWRRRIEFARISFADSTSINLVHDARGKWNFEGILLQAAHIDTAPTAQARSGSTPRFPYIEATAARVNLKQGVEKTPFSLTEADFALWLPDPSGWKMRVKGRPIRTDTSVSDTGILQLEATLGRAPSLSTVPLAVEATWSGAPLGEASRLFFGRDLGLRGELALTASIAGNLARNTVQTHLDVTRLRRSDFVPADLLSLNISCKATATRIFHELADLRCTWPIPGSNGATLALAGSVPDVLRPRSADIEVGTARLPAAILLGWLRVASSRVPQTLVATGLLSGSITHESAGDLPEKLSTSSSPQTHWTGQASIPELTLSGDRLPALPLALPNVLLRLAQPSPPGQQTGGGDLAQSHHPPARVVLAPVPLPLGGRDPASLEGYADSHGYSLHLTGIVAPGRVVALAAALPQLGDGLALVPPFTHAAPVAPLVHLDLTSHRPWAGVQLWTDNLAHTGTPQPHPRSHPPARQGERSRRLTNPQHAFRPQHRSH